MIPFLLVVVVVALAVGATASPPAAKVRRREAEPEDPIALADLDPIEALRLYGTPETADQLLAQGVDLAALGYRDGGDG